MKHLDAQTLSALSAREPEAVAYFREHLASPCDICEEFLAQHSGLEALDGRVDATLLRLAPPREAPLDEVGWRRLQRRLRAPTPLRRWVGAAAAMAACLLGGVLVPRMMNPGPEPTRPGVKGSSRITLELMAAVRSEEGRLMRLDPGARVRSEDVLILRYHSTETGSALLFQEMEGARPELLGSFRLEAGTHDLEGPQGLTGVNFSEEQGQVTLWLVASPAGEELSPEEIRDALPRGGTQKGSPLSTARFDVFVENGHNPH
jgi:hypothetical protein